jgi:hypothetical protein
MKYSKQFRQKFIDKANPDIIIEINEENMLGLNISFSRFYRLYQEKHRLKYGKELTAD